MTTVCIANQKGGVGKSTTSFALGTGLMKKGYTVLFIDIDQQGNLSYSMRSDPEKFNMNDVLIEKRCSINEAIQKTPNGEIIQSSKLLANAESHLTMVGREYKIKELLQGIRDSYDFIVFDTPPTLNILTVNALTASDYIIIPSEADIFCLQGIGQLYQTIAPIKEYCNPKLKIVGILLTKYNIRTNLSRDLTELIEDTAKQLGTTVFKSTIRDTVIIKEAHAKKAIIYDYAAKSNAAIDYLSFTDEFLDMIKEDQHA